MRRLLAPLVIGICLSSPALAQEAQDRATARRLAEQAQTAIDAKDFPTAIDRLSRAVALVPAPTLLLALGRAHREVGQLVEAEQRLIEASRFNVKPTDPASWREAAKQATTDAAAVSPRIPQLTLTLQPRGAAVNVTLDGRALSSASIGAPLAVNPGAHAIVITGPGGSRTETRTVAEREQAHIDLDVAALLVVAAPAASSSAAPAAPPPSAPAAGSTAPLTVKQKSPVPGYVALGASAVFVGVGAFAGLTAQRKTNTIKDSCVDGHCPTSLQSDRDSAARWADVSTVSFVFGAAAAGVGVYLLSRSRRAEIAVSPQKIEVRGAFLSVVWSRVARTGVVSKRRRTRRSVIRRRARGGRWRSRRCQRGQRRHRRGVPSGQRRQRGGWFFGRCRRGRGGCVRRRPGAQRVRQVRAGQLLRVGVHLPGRSLLHRLCVRSAPPRVLDERQRKGAADVRQQALPRALRHGRHRLQSDHQRGVQLWRRLRRQHVEHVRVFSARQRRAGVREV